VFFQLLSVMFKIFDINPMTHIIIKMVYLIHYKDLLLKIKDFRYKNITLAALPFAGLINPMKVGNYQMSHKYSQAPLPFPVDASELPNPLLPIGTSQPQKRSSFNS